MIVWSIDVAKDVPEICDILVSTDDPAIAAICTPAGAYVPWLRPTELATDNASSVDVALHALDWYEAERGAVDGLLLLQPTSPFRTRATVCEGINLFTLYGQQPVIGVSVSHSHPMWTLRIDRGYVVPFMQEHGLGTRSQDLPMAYIPNGAFYLTTPTHLRLSRSFVGDKAVPLLIDSPQEALDIDTSWDFELAKLIADAASEI